MYQKYQTDAVVLASREIGEADKAYALLTSDFGLVRARASAVRSEASKMRYALQDYASAHVSLVRGKRGWRVAGARATESSPVHGVHSFARAAELVVRLVPGEEKNEYLYQVFRDARSALSEGGDMAAIEILCVARVLYTLGYISSEALSATLFVSTSFGPEDLQEVHARKELLLGAINKALTETHL